MMNHKSLLLTMSQRGSTLIETVIYTGIVAMMVGLFLFTAYEIIDANTKLQNKIIVEEEANFLLRKMDWGLTGVVNIVSPAAGATSTVLSINKSNFPSNPVVFDLNSGNIRLTLGAQNPNILNSQQIEIDNLIFQQIASTTATPPAVSINLTIGSQEFTNIIYLRQ